MPDQHIVIAGSFNGLTTEFGIANGFRKLGWQVTQVDCAEYSANYSGMYARIASRLRLPLTIRNYNEAIIEKVKAVSPPFFLTVKGNYITAKTLQRIRQLDVVTVNYWPDLHFNHPGVHESDLVHYNRIFTTKSFHVEYLVDKLGADRVDFLHHGYVSGFHEPPSQKQSTEDGADIVYIGSHTAEKERWMRAVKMRFPQAKLRIYGNRWNTIPDKELFGDSIAGVSLHGQEYAQAINSAKINIAVHMGVLDQSGWSDLVSTRTFEIPACKGFMLHVDNAEVRRLFTPGTEIDVFNNTDELLDKISYYLDHDTIRQDMVERAFARCVPAYSYDERARVIAGWILSEM